MHMFISTMLRMLRMFIYISSTPQHSNKTPSLHLIQILEMKRLTWAYVGTSDHNLKLNLPTWNNLLPAAIQYNYNIWLKRYKDFYRSTAILPGTHTAFFFIPNRQVSPPKPGCQVSLGDLRGDVQPRCACVQALGQSAPAHRQPGECPRALSTLG